ncbi:hypothetical protein D3C81_1458360 [compost metagenome]
MLAHRLGDAGVGRVGGGQVLALDVVGGNGGSAAAVEEAELAAHFNLFAGAQVKVAHLGERCGGEDAGGRVGGGAVLHVDVGRRRQLVDQANTSGGGFVDALEVARIVGVDSAVVVDLQVDMVVAQAGQQ